MNKKIKIIIGLVISLVLIFLVLLILPFVIDLNRFKPQIQEAVAKQANAHIDFSSIQLTILTGLGVQLENVVVENTDDQFKGTKFVQVQNIKFSTKLIPLLSGKIVGNIEINSPDINLVKEGDNNNVTSLMKGDKKTNSTKMPLKNQEQEQKSVPLETPSGNTSKQETLVQNNTPQEKNNIIKDILIESFLIKNAKFSFFDKVTKKNPLIVDKLNLNISNIGLDKETQIIFSTNVDLNNPDYQVQGPLSLKIIANTSMENSQWKKSTFNGEFNFDKLAINYKKAFEKSNHIPFHFSFKGNAEPNSLLLNDFDLKLQSLELQAKLALNDFTKLNSDLHITLSSKDVSSLSEILPQYKSLLTKGDFNLDSNIKGSLSNTDKLNSNTKLDANLYQSDIHLSLEESSLKPINSHLRAQSKQLNLGEILKPFMGKDFAYGNIVLNNLDLDSSMANDTVQIQKLNLNAFKGNMASNFIVNLSQNPMNYTGHMGFKHIQIQDLIKVIQLKEGSPLDGDVDLSFNFNGKGTTRDVISKTLNAKGDYAFYSGQLNLKNILNTASDQLVTYTSKNIPALSLGASKLKNLNFGQNTTGLKNNKGIFEIKNGHLIIDNNLTSEQGNIKLNASVGLDETLSGTALYTASNSIKDGLVSLDKNFVYLLDKKGDFQLKLILGGLLANPDVKIDPANLKDNILHNTSQIVRDKIKEQIKDQIKNNPQAQKIEEDAKKILKDKGLDLGKFGL